MADQDSKPRTRGRPRSAFADSKGTTVQALDRGLSLLGLLATAGRATLTDLALRAGMPASTAYRLLVTMQKHGIAEFDEATQHWMIGVEAFRIGSTFLRRTDLVEASREAMRRLMEETGETANLAIAEDGEVVFVSQVETPHPIRAFFPPGQRGAMHASGIGKALMAEMPRAEVERILSRKGLAAFTAKTLTSPDDLFADLDRARARGWAFDDEERYEGMRCIAAPIHNAFGEAVAGISISGPSARFDDRAVSELGPTVRRAAAEVTSLIGGSTPDHKE